MAGTQAIFYRESRGAEPVNEFIDGLPAKRAAKIDDFIAEHLNDQPESAPPPNFPISSQIEGELRELRIRFANTRYRVLYQRSDNLMVLLHAFEKNTGAVPEQVGALLAVADQPAWSDRRPPDEPLYVRLAEREPTRSERANLEALVLRHRRTQLQRLDDLAAQFGEGPKLYRKRVSLAIGELLTRNAVDSLPRDAERDRDARAEQERLRDEYLSWREREAKRLAKNHGVIERRRIGRDAFLERVDRAALRRCSGCEEIAYPNPERASGYTKRHVAERCHYCGGLVAAEINPDEGPA